MDWQISDSNLFKTITNIFHQFSYDLNMEEISKSDWKEAKRFIIIEIK